MALLAMHSARTCSQTGFVSRAIACGHRASAQMAASTRAAAAANRTRAAAGVRPPRAAVAPVTASRAAVRAVVPPAVSTRAARCRQTEVVCARRTSVRAPRWTTFGNGVLRPPIHRLAKSTFGARARLAAVHVCSAAMAHSATMTHLRRWYSLLLVLCDLHARSVSRRSLRSRRWSTAGRWMRESRNDSVATSIRGAIAAPRTRARRARPPRAMNASCKHLPTVARVDTCRRAASCSLTSSRPTRSKIYAAHRTTRRISNTSRSRPSCA